jgi:hypothetical protein
LSDRVITTLVSYYMSGSMLSILYSELRIIPMVILSDNFYFDRCTNEKNRI